MAKSSVRFLVISLNLVYYSLFPFPFCKIPVFKGAAKPVLGKGISAGHFHGMDGLGDAPDPNAPGLDLVQKESAVSAMIRIVDENPGEVRFDCPWSVGKLVLANSIVVQKWITHLTEFIIQCHKYYCCIAL